jgi:putative ABC transport system permease protein
VAIISETMARRYWPNEDPVGKRFRPEDSRTEAPWLAVAGVVRDVVDPLSPQMEAMFYRPYLQIRAQGMWLVVRTLADPANLSSALRNEVWTLDKDQPIPYLLTMEQEFSVDVAAAPSYAAARHLRCVIAASCGGSHLWRH